MTNKEKIHELLDMCLDIQMNGHGTEGYPYIYCVICNYGTEIEICIKDNGFNEKAGYDGKYNFDFNHISERMYKNCREHLYDLKEKVEACTTMNAPTVEHI